MKSLAYCLLLTSLAVFPSRAAEPSALMLSKTIPLAGVKGRIDHLALDAPGKRLFIAALGNNTVEVLDLGEGKRLRTLTGCAKPQGVLLVPQLSRLYVANGGSGELHVYDAETLKLLGKIPSLDDADNIRFDVKAGLVFVGYGEGALSIVNGGKSMLSGKIALSGHPESFQLETGTARIFVNVPDARQVAVIDRGNQAVVATWPVTNFTANFPLALDEANHRLFLGCRKSARLVVLDTQTGKSVADLAISGDTDDLFYDAKRRRLYAACGEGFIDVIEQRDADTYAMKEKIPTRTGARTGLFSPELNEFYLAVPERNGQPAELRVFKVQ
ncbi:MAG: YncE family protein [Verrucomicrobia bacterium]|nr:YncE family protein [Verrucomicrobiota bacterium]